VRHKALAVIEGANLLLMDGRLVAHPGQKLSEPGGQGDFTPEQSQAALSADRATYVAYAEALRGAAELMLAAIEKRDIEAMLETGGALDEACEACHRKFWYPNSPLPPGA
jgi:cytochrome c556